VYGDGSQTRSFCYVTDLVRGLRALAGTEDASGDVVNIGSTNELTINTLAEIVRGITDGDVDIVYEPLPEDDPQQRRPDISRARQLLDWEPTVTLEKGLKRTVDYFSAQRPE
jgi:UDP-glucuronate decarboxylase